MAKVMNHPARLLCALLALVLPNLVAARLPQKSELLAHCSTAEAFCNSVLSGIGGYRQKVKRVIAYSTSSTATYSYPHSTTTTWYTTTTTMSATYTVTATAGSHTTTVQQCHPVTSCGPVTFSGNQAVVRAGCTGALDKLSGRAKYTVTYNQPEAFVYGSTTTFTYTVTATTTSFPLTTTTIPTKTEYDCVTVSPPAMTCNNKGVQVGVWELTKEDEKNPPLKWDLDYYKTHKPLSHQDYYDIGGYHVDESSKRKKTKKKKRHTESVSGCYYNGEYNNARGYILAPQTGTYHFDIPAYDQAAFIWVGDVAYTGYEVNNALLKAVKANHSMSGGPSKAFHMEAGKYYPFRSAYRCVIEQDYSYWFNIRRPDGFVMFGQYQRHGEFPSLIGSSSYSIYHTGVHYIVSDYVVQFGCGADAKEAPEFPPFGQET